MTFQLRVNPPSNVFPVSYDHIQAKVYYTESGGGGGAATGTKYIHPDHLGGNVQNQPGSGNLQSLLGQLSTAVSKIGQLLSDKKQQ